MITVHWCALYTKPHKERQVGGFLESKGYEVYVPGIRVRRRGRERLELLFSCYLFARLNGSGDVSSVRFTPGLRRIVSFGGEPAIVPDEVIALTREHLTREPSPWFGVKTRKQVSLWSLGKISYRRRLQADV